MRLRGFLPDRLRVVAQRLETDLQAIGRRIVMPRRDVFTTSHHSRVARVRPTVREVSQPLEATPLAPINVRFEDGPAFLVRETETILSAALAAGVEMEFSCTLGGCGACMLELVSGEVRYDDPLAICLSESEIADGWCLACVGRPQTPLVLRR